MCSRHTLPVVVLCALLAGAAADLPSASVTTYTLHSRGLRVGSVRTERERILTNGQEAVRCGVTTHVRVNLLVVRHNLEANEVYVSSGGRPLAYEHVRRENGEERAIRGVREGDRFVFLVTENGATTTSVVHDADYDAVGMEGPELALSEPGATNTLRVLDVGAARVIERSYCWIRSEDGLRVVEYADANKSGTRWVRGDEFGLFIARQEGREKSGSYSMRMTDAKKE
jgi:hypothetical protein